MRNEWTTRTTGNSERDLSIKNIKVLIPCITEQMRSRSLKTSALLYLYCPMEGGEDLWSRDYSPLVTVQALIALSGI